MHPLTRQKKSMQVICQYLPMNCIRIKTKCGLETKNRPAIAKRFLKNLLLFPLLIVRASVYWFDKVVISIGESTLL